MSSPAPSARSPAASVASRSPPWAPTPGTKIQHCGATRRTSARDSGKVAPTTRLTLDDHAVALLATCMKSGWFGSRSSVRQSLISNSWKSAEPGLDVRQSTNSPCPRRQERLKAVASEVWAERDGIDAPVFKAGLGMAAAVLPMSPRLASRMMDSRAGSHRSYGAGAYNRRAKGFVEGDVRLVVRGIGAVAPIRARFKPVGRL